MRELGFLIPMSTSSLQRPCWARTQGSADNEPMERRAGHGLGAWAGLVVRPDCVVVLEVDLASVTHAVAWDFEFTRPNSVQRLRNGFGRFMTAEVRPACACVHALQLVHDLPEAAAGRRHERQDVDPQARLVALRVLAEKADIFEGDHDADSFEAVARERAQELVVLAGVRVTGPDFG
jgi:hypothetical protein